MISGAVNVLRAFQEDTLLCEQESHTMRQAARAHASALPAYPVFQNKEQYDQLDSEEQLEYREQATLASEARRRMLMDTVGCSYSTARDSLRSGTKDLDKVVDHALYMTYMESSSDPQPMSDPNTDPDGTPTLTQVYLAAEPAPRHIMDRTDPAALLGSALSPTADDSIKQGWIQDTALSTMLRCSYSAEDSIMGADAVGDMYAPIRGYTPPAPPAHTTASCFVYAALPDKSNQKPVVELTGNEMINEFLGEHFMPMVGAVEVPIKQVIASHPAQAKAAIDKELHAMHETRHRLVSIDETTLTEYEKKRALELRMAMPWKRPTAEETEAATEEQLAGGTAGTLKGRLVAKDLKVINKLPEEQTFAGVPEMSAVRLIIADTDTCKHKLSTTDFDTAYLQTPDDKEEDWILTKRYCPFTHKWIYEKCTGNIYGKQVGAKVWKDKVHSDLTSAAFGFTEIRNTHSLYYNPTRDIILSMHVDDPLIRTCSDDDQAWVHSMLDKHFDTKGIRKLTVDNPLDYLSIRIMLHGDGMITMDNKDKIDVFLKQHGMLECNPVSTPLTKDMLLEVAKGDQTPMDEAGKKHYQSVVGDGIWLVATTHPVLATSTSILAGFNACPPVGAAFLLQHYLRYMQHVKGHCLVRNPNPSMPGIVHYSDSDWAGLYAYTGETRSRSGFVCMYNGMPVSWYSKHQKCKGTSHKEELSTFHIATASGEAELYAAADAVKASQHLRYVGEELSIKMGRIIVMLVDATAAIGKVQGPRGGGKMKHIDLRADWINELRDLSICVLEKVPGEENLADGFTKLLGRNLFRVFVELLMPFIIS